MAKKITDIIGELPKKAAETAGQTLSDLKESVVPQRVTKTAKKITDYIHENMLIFIMGLICIVIVLIIAVLVALSVGGLKTRIIKITEIQGSVSIERDFKKYTGTKNSAVHSGDIVTVADNGRAKLRIDPDKFLIVEPGSQLYIDYTNIEGQGAVSANVVYGSVIVRIDNTIGEKDLFRVNTPNSSIDVKNGVMRAFTEYYDDYADESPAKITDIQVFTGAPYVQLYDWEGAPNGQQMLLGELKNSRLVTMEKTSRFGMINAELNLKSLPELTLSELVRISNDKNIGIPPLELNAAYKEVVKSNYPTASSPTIPEFNSEQEIISIVTVSTTPATTTTVEAVTTAEIIETLPTTVSTLGEMTEYTGQTWWTEPGNTIDNDSIDNDNIFIDE
ncbi:MAG: FecR family protein [Ruminococcus sp.]|jgi:hypothetical protein|nr:FecR family protein [Ruminococcus sp.]